MQESKSNAKKPKKYFFAIKESDTLSSLSAAVKNYTAIFDRIIQSKLNSSHLKLCLSRGIKSKAILMLLT